jgi:hypothetical protein
MDRTESTVMALDSFQISHLLSRSPSSSFGVRRRLVVICLVAVDMVQSTWVNSLDATIVVIKELRSLLQPMSGSAETAGGAQARAEETMTTFRQEVDIMLTWQAASSSHTIAM